MDKQSPKYYGSSHSELWPKNAEFPFLFSKVFLFTKLIYFQGTSHLAPHISKCDHRIQVSSFVSSPFIIVPAITALSVTLWIYWSLFNISILSYQIIGININGTLNKRAEEQITS
jgi:hypothetical protein